MAVEQSHRHIRDPVGPDDLSQLLGDHATRPAAAADQPLPDADPTVVVDVPGLVAEHLADAADTAVRQALAAGQTIRRGQGYSVRVTAPLTVHRAMIEHSATALVQ
ncbi:hypothetical protein ACFV30_41870 [Streptomyces sp. NPDC059752]|uniref:hypothetical protein n=1 Tax=unclassified Streptomyces TaxID=2593676 RepID=UPI00366665E4